MSNDVIATLSNSLADEYNDVLKYKKIAKEAGDSDGIAQILSDIAREEYTHASHIEEILKDCGKSNIDSSEVKELKEKAQKALTNE